MIQGQIKKGGAIFITPPLVFRPQYAGVGV